MPIASVDATLLGEPRSSIFRGSYDGRRGRLFDTIDTKRFRIVVFPPFGTAEGRGALSILHGREFLGGKDVGSAGDSERRPWSEALSIALMLLGVAAWLRPIGFGGKMPVGGDATQFSMGLMAVLGKALRDFRLPLWNELWGYGFPGLAESQMGVFYPPHWVLYGWMRVETGYVSSLMLHTFWAALGAYWAARKFGASATGAAIAGFAWSTCGFYRIHIPHQWGYTTGSWMPWPWGLARSLRDRPTARTALLLSAVLALQVLPGHFQLAFITQVGTLLVLSTWRRGAEGRAVPDASPALDQAARSIVPSPSAANALPLRMIPIVFGFAGLLCLLQLGPTWELARLAESRRDYEYLSGFASSPWHFVSVFAPELFRRSPLWRPIAWDMFHTSPEELLDTIGLVPIFLAWRAWRDREGRDLSVRILALVAAVTIILELGPYVPGFSWYSRWPGFSFFRAPARWGLATSLALALLAGRGWDGFIAARRISGGVRFAFVAILLPCLLVGGFEFALFATETKPETGSARLLASFARLLPWSGDPPLVKWMDAARRPQGELREQIVFARRGEWRPNTAGLDLPSRRFSIYLEELGPSVGFAVLLAIGTQGLSRLPRILAIWLVAMLLAEVLTIGRSRNFDFGPTAPLVEQSKVLAILGERAGGRVVDPSRNLAMVSGVAPISAYRTLDLPAVPELTMLGHQPLGRPEIDAVTARALRLTGARLRVLDPFETRRLGRLEPKLDGWKPIGEPVDDPVLAGWLFGEDWVAVEGAWASRFMILEATVEPARAWFLPRTEGRSAESLSGAVKNPLVILRDFEAAKPLVVSRATREAAAIEFVADGPGTVVWTETHYPRWKAEISGPSGPVAELPTTPAVGGWQAVEIRSAGKVRVVLRYESFPDFIYLSVSACSWAAWILLFVRGGLKPIRGLTRKDEG